MFKRNTDTTVGDVTRPRPAVPGGASLKTLVPSRSYLANSALIDVQLVSSTGDGAPPPYARA